MAPVTAPISKTLAQQLRLGGPVFCLKWVPQLCQSSFSTSAPAISSLSEPEVEQRGSRWSRLLLFVPGAITFGLGTWQIFRRQDKIKMLEYRQKKLVMEPINCIDSIPSNEDLDSLGFRRMVCKGVFDDKKSIYVGPRSRSISGVTEIGYYVVTPLMPILNNPESVKSPILVNRGWAPQSWRDKSSRVSEDDGQPSTIKHTTIGEKRGSSWWWFGSKKPDIVQVPDVKLVEVVGVVRGSENPSNFVPANDPRSFQWFYVDVPAIARTCGLPENTIYIEDINEKFNPSNPYPVPKDPNTLIRSSVMPQDHLNYTLTWYSLSAAVTFMAFKRLRPKKSRR